MLSFLLFLCLLRPVPDTTQIIVEDPEPISGVVVDDGVPF